MIDHPHEWTIPVEARLAGGASHACDRLWPAHEVMGPLLATCRMIQEARLNGEPFDLHEALRLVDTGLGGMRAHQADFDVIAEVEEARQTIRAHAP